MRAKVLLILSCVGEWAAHTGQRNKVSAKKGSLLRSAHDVWTTLRWSARSSTGTVSMLESIVQQAVLRQLAPRPPRLSSSCLGSSVASKLSERGAPPPRQAEDEASHGYEAFSADARTHHTLGRSQRVAPSLGDPLSQSRLGTPRAHLPIAPPAPAVGVGWLGEARTEPRHPQKPMATGCGYDAVHLLYRSCAGPVQVLYRGRRATRAT